MICINLDDKYAKGLRGLDGYSHVQVLWWADGCDNESKRNVLVEEKSYKNGPDEIGVFALHSPERPNPIAVSRAAPRTGGRKEKASFQLSYPIGQRKMA